MTATSDRRTAWASTDRAVAGHRRAEHVAGRGTKAQLTRVDKPSPPVRPVGLGMVRRVVHQMLVRKIALSLPEATGATPQEAVGFRVLAFTTARSDSFASRSVNIMPHNTGDRYQIRFDRLDLTRPNTIGVQRHGCAVFMGHEALRAAHGSVGEPGMMVGGAFSAAGRVTVRLRTGCRHCPL